MYASNVNLKNLYKYFSAKHCDFHYYSLIFHPDPPQLAVRGKHLGTADWKYSHVFTRIAAV